MKEFFKNIFTSLWRLSTVLSFLLFIATAVIKVTWKDDQVVLGNTKFVLIAAVVFFLLAIVTYYVPRKTAKRLGPAPTGSITSPRQGDHCAAETNFLGEIVGKPREGWEFWLIRRFADRAPFYPEEKVKLGVEGKGTTRAWSADKVFVGGEGRPKEERHFELWMVSPDVSALFEHSKKTTSAYWNQVNPYKAREKDEGREALIYPFKPLPAFDGKLMDVVEIARVRVYRDPKP